MAIRAPRRTTASPPGSTRLPDSARVQTRYSPSAFSASTASVSSSSTVDELQGALAESVQSHLGDLELEYAGGRQVRLRGLGWGLERTWQVAGTAAGLRSIAVPACNATGNLVVWQLWTDGEGRDLADWWLGTLRTRGGADPPVCSELNP